VLLAEGVDLPTAWEASRRGVSSDATGGMSPVSHALCVVVALLAATAVAVLLPW